MSRKIIHFKPFLFLPCLLLIILTTNSLLYAETTASTDSSTYWCLRNQLPNDKTTLSILQTADALAEEGLYKEAAEILSTLITPQTTIDTNHVNYNSNETTYWRISLGTDYYHLEDFDSTEMSIEEYHDHQRLTEFPLSLWGRAKYTITLDRGILRKFTPNTFISNYRSSFELPVMLLLLKNRLSLETTAKAGKWFQADARDSSHVDILQLHPSDMGGFLLRCIPGSSTENSSKWTWSTPIVVDWEHYNKDRTGYESLIEYRLMPTIEYRQKGRSSLSARFIGEAHYENYYRSISDTLDVLRGMIHLESAIRSDWYYLQIKSAWFHDNYLNASSPSTVNRWKSTIRYEHKTGEFFSPRLTIQTIHEQEHYDPSTTTASFSLPGTKLSINPSLRLTISEALFIEPEGTWEKQWTDLTNDSYLWKALSSWETAIHTVLILTEINASCTIAYQWEQIDPSFHHIMEDNRNIHLLFDGSYSITSNFTINLQFDYRYRIYSPYNSDSRLTENITAAANVLINW